MKKYVVNHWTSFLWNIFFQSLGIKNILHRKRLHLHLQTICNNATNEKTIEGFHIENLNLIDTNWITSNLNSHFSVKKQFTNKNIFSPLYRMAR
jgi:hypothetical protein